MTEAAEVDTAFEVEADSLAPTLKRGQKPKAVEAMSTEDLVELFAKVIGNSNQQLADSILKLREEPVDPAKQANEKFDREQARKQRQRIEAAVKQAQKDCPHLAGSNSLSDQPDLLGRTCIIWHTSDSSETYGLCLNCQRQFHENDEDYAMWRRKPSICKQSRAGERFFSDPMRARAIARGEIASN
jgi:hypothetical protein